MYACRNVDMLETEGSLAPVVSYIMNISFAWCRVQTYQFRRAESRLLPLGGIRTDEVGASGLASFPVVCCVLGSAPCFNHWCWPTRPTLKRCIYKNLRAIVDRLELRTLCGL